MMQYWDWELSAKAGLNPSNTRCRSNKKANWICRQCPKGQLHRWQATIGNMFEGSGCPCCSGCKACNCNSLQSLYPEVAAEWDYIRNTGTPSDYPTHSQQRVWWYNSKRGHVQATTGSCTAQLDKGRKELQVVCFTSSNTATQLQCFLLHSS